MSGTKLVLRELATYELAIVENVDGKAKITVIDQEKTPAVEAFWKQVMKHGRNRISQLEAELAVKDARIKELEGAVHKFRKRAIRKRR
jgi:hypothetical protein